MHACMHGVVKYGLINKVHISKHLSGNIYVCFNGIYNWGNKPPGGHLPHTEGRLTPRMGQDAFLYTFF